MSTERAAVQTLDTVWAHAAEGDIFGAPFDYYEVIKIIVCGFGQVSVQALSLSDAEPLAFITSTAAPVVLRRSAGGAA